MCNLVYVFGTRFTEKSCFFVSCDNTKVYSFSLLMKTSMELCLYKQKRYKNIEDH